MQKAYLLISFFCVLNILNAQRTVTAKLIDSITQKPIPYATISLNDKYGVISNENGEFNMTIKKKVTSSDSLHISCLGYEKKLFPLETFNKPIVYLAPKIVDLDEVYISNKDYTADEIIQLVKDSIQSNYDFGYVKRKLFFRESNYAQINKSEFNIKRSTIPEINQKFVDSILADIPKNIDDHTEILAELYGKIGEQHPQKLEILKAAELIDRKNEVTFENYEKRFNDILRKYVKRDSYFKIKSGWFGGKEAIDSTFFETDSEKKEREQTDTFIEQRKKDELARKSGFLNFRKQHIHKFENHNFLSDDNKLNFLKKSNRYNFELLDYQFLDDAFVYKISFKPKRKAKFEGVIYVNTDDFAIVRADYKNVRDIKNFNLLGVSFKNYLREGTIIFQKNTNSKYVLKFMDETQGATFGVKRPLKIVEKNKNVRGRRKQNEVSGKLNFMINTLNKNEYIAFETSEISVDSFNSFNEKPEVTPTWLSAYDPNFWIDYNIIEPNEAIKGFKVIEEDE